MNNRKPYILLAMGITMYLILGTTSVSAANDCNPYVRDIGEGMLEISSSVKWVEEEGKCVHIKEAKSLKDKYYNGVLLFDMKYLKDDRANYDFEVIDYNYTTFIFNMVLKNETKLDKDIPFRVDSYKVKDKVKINKKFKVKDEKHEITYVTSDIFAENYTIGGNSTTVSLGTSEVAVDGRAYDGGDYEIQIKWDISSVPASNNIDGATLCVYSFDTYNDGSCDNDGYIQRINDQGWDNTLNAADYNSQSETNSSLVTYNESAVVAGGGNPFWVCVNVTDVIKTDYDASNTYSTIRFGDPDEEMGTATSVGWSDNDIVIGDHPQCYLKMSPTEDGEHSGDDPILYVNYSAVGAITMILDEPTNITYNMTNIRIQGSTDVSGNISYSWNGGANTTIDNETMAFSVASSGATANVANRLDVYAVSATDPTKVDNKTVFLSIDTAAPTVTVATPTGTEVYRQNTSIPYTFSATDYGDVASGIDECYYTLDGGDEVNIAACANGSISTGVNKYASWTLDIYGNDTVGNEGTDSTSFTYDPLLNFSINDSLGGYNILTFTMEHTNNSNSWETTNGSLSIPLSELGLGQQEIIFSTEGYNTTKVYVDIVDTSKFNASWLVAPSSVSMRVFDETQAALGIFTNITFNITLYNSTFSQTFTDQGLFFQRSNNTPVGDVTVDLTAYGYTPRRVYLWINGTSAQSFDFYMLPTADSFLVRFHTVTVAESSIAGVTVEARRFINSTWTRVGQQVTDVSGVGAIYLYPFATYQIEATHVSYDNSTISLQPSSSDYKIYMTTTSASDPFSSTVGNVSMLFNPEITSVNASLQEFSCLAYATDNSLEYVGMSIQYFNGTYFYINSTNTTSGIRLNYTVDLLGLNNTNLTASCGFKKTGESWYNISRVYYIYGEVEGLTGIGITGALSTFSKLGLSIISIIITAMGMGFIGKISGNTGAAALGGLLILGLMTFWLGWFDWLVFTLLVVVLASFSVLKSGGRI